MNLDTQTLIHVGTELVVVGGIAFWLNKRIGAVDAKYDDILKRLVAYEEIIEKQNQMIARHEAAFQRLFGGPPPNPQALQASTSAGAGNPPPPLGKSPNPAQNKSAPVPNQKTPSARVEEIQDDEKDDEETPADISPDQLDLLLQQELAQLDGKTPKKERRRRDPKTLKSRGKITKTKSEEIVADPQ